MLRFHLDENVNAAVAGALVGRGFDVTTAVSAGLRTASDPDHLAFALEQHRVLVTHDADFLRIQASGADHAGIAYALPDRSLGDLVRGLVLLAECLTAEDMRRHVEFV